ncbi:MAG: NAD-dependent epimerase/dehydratase family protein [Aggregatilineales bacterium]
MMDILVIGGSQFVGKAQIETLLAAGHSVTMFNRGKSHPDAFPDVERVTGDRDGDLSNLPDKTWDAVIDTCGYIPRIVRLSAEYLKDRVKQYVFVSTISVYEDGLAPNFDEDAPLKTLEDESVEEVTGETYGGLKVLCENVVQELYPDTYLISRPGLIVGPYDPINRLPYWVTRIAQGGRVLAPGKSENPLQLIDARDIADWTLKQVEAGNTGIYNMTGPDANLTLGTLFETIKTVSGSDAEFVWADDAFLQSQELVPFQDLPYWLPEPTNQTLFSVGIQRGIDTGLTFRSLETTIQDTLDWLKLPETEQPGRAGISRERESDALAAFDAQ